MLGFRETLAACAVACSTIAFCGLVILAIVAVVNRIGRTEQEDLKDVDDRLNGPAEGSPKVGPSVAL